MISKIAIASVAIGLAAVLISFMILWGYKEKIEGKIYSFAGHMQVTKYTLGSSFEEQPISTTSQFYQHYDSVPFIDHVQAYGYKAGLLKTKEEVQGIVIKGIGLEYDSSRFSANMIEGQFLNLPDSGYSTDIILSKKLSYMLELGVGDDALVYFVQNPPRYRPVDVVGIYETGLEDFDEKFVIGDLRLVQRINNWPDSLIGGLEVYVKPGTDIDYAENYLFDFIDYDLYVEKVSDKYIQIFDWLSLLDRNLQVFLWLILFVAAFNMVSILLILIMERTQMIGMFKALGATDQLIRRIFVYNGGLLILKGMLIGNLVALSLGVLQYYFRIIPLDPVNYYIDHVPIAWNIPIIILLNILTFVLVTITLLVPTLFISRIQPIRAIRFD